MPVELRALEISMKSDLARLANDPEIFVNVRDFFPHPYSELNAEEFISRSSMNPAPLEYAILTDGAFAGVCGFTPGTDIHRLTAEVGYWIGKPFRGKGVASVALRQLCDVAFSRGFVRLYAGVFETNQPSMRVLEKSGFTLESIRKKGVIKQGKILDEHLFVLLRPDTSL